MAFTDAEKLAEVKREIRMRHSVYPKLIKGKKLTEADAARQIAILEAVVKDYDGEPPPKLPGL